MQAENQTGLKDKISGLENNSKDFARKKHLRTGSGMESESLRGLNRINSKSNKCQIHKVIKII